MKKVLLLLLQTLLTASMFAQNYTETESYAGRSAGQVFDPLDEFKTVPVIPHVRTSNAIAEQI